MFQFSGLAPLLVIYLQYTRLSHSEIFGSRPVCGYPKLIAAYHVLHRLLVPRHPPCALIRFKYCFNLHPCISTGLHFILLPYYLVSGFNTSTKNCFPNISKNFAPLQAIIPAASLCCACGSDPSLPPLRLHLLSFKRT